MKKWLRCCISVLLVLIGALLFAAGEQEASTGVVEIKFWHSWAPEGPQGQVLQGLMDEFNAAHAGEISISGVFMGQKRNEKIAATLAAGEPPDVAWVSDSGENYYEAGQLLPMSEVYDAGIVDPDDIFPGLIDNLAYIGINTVLPFENSNIALFYNKKMLADQGVAFPAPDIGDYTWSDFVRDAKKFSDPANNKYGWEPLFRKATLTAVFWSKGGKLLSDDFKTNLLVSDPQMQKLMIESLYQIYRTVWVDRITANNIGDQGFHNNDMPFNITGPWNMPRFTKPAGHFDPGAIGVAPFPADDKIRKTVSYWYAKALALFETDERRQEATLQFIKWFYSPEIQARWGAGAGYLPITISGTRHPVWLEHQKENPWTEVFLEQAYSMRRTYNGLPDGGIAPELLDPVRFNKMTPEEALAAYNKDAQLLLDEFWSLH